LIRLLEKFRPKEKAKFPKSLEEAREAVLQLQEKYKEKLGELLKQTSSFDLPEVEPDEQRRKPREEEDDDENDVASIHANEPEDALLNAELIQGGINDFSQEDEDIGLKEEQHETQPEDEDVLRDLERALMETYQVCFNVEETNHPIV
jgi:hypothetical protein